MSSALFKVSPPHIKSSFRMRLKLVPPNSVCFSTKISSAQSKPQPQPTKTLSGLVSRQMMSSEDGHQQLDPQYSNHCHDVHVDHQPAQFNALAQPLFPQRGHPFKPGSASVSHQAVKQKHTKSLFGPSQYLSKFFDSLAKQDFDSVIANFNQLSFSEKSRLSAQAYSHIFSLASQIRDHDLLIEPTDKLNPEFHPYFRPHPQNKSYKIDYCQVHTRLAKVDQAFQSAQRPFSTEELHAHLEITILAAALRLRNSSAGPTSFISSSSSAAPQPNFDSLFTRYHQLIANIISRLPALNQIPIPNAHQLAQAIPFNTLGLYLRFLVVFHRPNQGLRQIRKIYYAYLINRREELNNTRSDEIPMDCSTKEDVDIESNQLSSDLFAVETGSLIISLLRHKIHHRLAALKLAIRMITMGQVFPDHTHFTSLLRRMYMSKSEWDSVIQLQAELVSTSVLASNWLMNQIAIVEAEDGRVERALSLSAQVLKLPPDLHGDFLSPATGVNSDIFAHAIHALINNSAHHPNALMPGGLRGAIAIRTKMLESGLLPPPESDDLILRRIIFEAQRIKSWFARREFLKEMVASMFPVEKIVPIRSDSLRSFKFQSHPGKSPEAFRLMRWLMRWNELDLSLQVFQSLSRYGYVTSFTSIPFYYLKKILQKALHSHPELAMELYQHFHMSGSDPSGELFKAIQIKSIKMGDHQLASYLLRIIERSHHHHQTQLLNQITHFLIGFSNRKSSPGNVLKTLLLHNFVWIRWPTLVGLKVWKSISNHIKRAGPYKISHRQEVQLEIEKFIQILEQSTRRLNHPETQSIKAGLNEFLQTTKFLNQPENNQDPHDSIPSDHTDTLVEIQEENSTDKQNDLELNEFEDLIHKYLDENEVKKAVEVIESGISSDNLIRGPTFGRLLNRLIDDLLNEFDAYNEDINSIDLIDVDVDDDNQKKKKDLNYYQSQVHHIFRLNQSWRSMSWRFSLNQKGDDLLVVQACIKLFDFLNRIDRHITL